MAPTFLAPLISLVMLLVLWRGRVFARPGLNAAFCVTGLALQQLAPLHSVPWMVGLAWNTALAIYFLLLAKLHA